MINPELYYHLWKQENAERLRTAARRQAVRDAQLTRVAGHSFQVNRSTSADRTWLRLLGDSVLRLRGAGRTPLQSLQTGPDLKQCQPEC
jgi:hypothetical protein